MSDFDRNVSSMRYDQALSPAEAAAIDAGLRAYMLRVYNYMVLGLAITGFAALGIYMLSVTGDPAAAAKGVRALRGGLYLTEFGRVLFVSPLKWAVILAPLALVLVLSFGVERMRPAFGQVLFWIYAALVGVSLGVIFMVYTQTSIVRVFFITAASFGALSLWGYTTKRDLTGMGSFLMMGLFGVIIAMLVNLFLQSIGAAVHRLGGRRAGVRRPDRLGHPAAQERVHLRRHGRGDHRAFGHPRRALALPQLHQPVHAASAAARPARGIARSSDDRSVERVRLDCRRLPAVDRRCPPHPCGAFRGGPGIWVETLRNFRGRSGVRPGATLDSGRRGALVGVPVPGRCRRKR